MNDILWQPSPERSRGATAVLAVAGAPGQQPQNEDNDGEPRTHAVSLWMTPELIGDARPR